MGNVLRNRRWFRILTQVCRVLFAVTFIFSGTVKAVDPWGTALNIGNYLASYHLTYLDPWILPFSVWLCGAELMMGLMLLFKVRIRLISIFAVASMAFFTVLTLLSATVIPIEDCGCFGSAIKLTAWQTFAKNLVLLPMAIVVWYRYRPDSVFTFNRMEVSLTVLFCALSMGLGTYSCLHLPPFDFLPYGVGVNIAEDMEKARMDTEEQEVVLVYRNRKTGKLKEFSLKDNAWRNEKKWEWVDTRVDETPGVEPTILEFYVSTSSGRDVTDSLLRIPGRLHLLCINDLEHLSGKCLQSMGRLSDGVREEGDAVVCLTAGAIPSSGTVSFDSCSPIACYNMDAKTLKTILRAAAGDVVLTDGVITSKINCRDIE